MKNLSNNLKRIFRIAVILNVLLLCFIFYQLFFSKYYWQGNDEKKFNIEPGKSLDEIIYNLKTNDIIPDAFLFKIVVILTGNQSKIISNNYLMKNGMSNYELLRLITDNTGYQLIRFTIPPGYNLRQIAGLAEKKLLLSAEKFIFETENDSLINILGLTGQVRNLEGFLFPDSYDLPPTIKERDLVFLLFDEFKKKVFDNEKIKSQIEVQETSLLKIITLASIIEGETLIDEEKPVIAGVYLNRIAKGMKLQADPTIQYILPGGWKARLLYEDLKIDSPYNTYKYKGLPPGPINNPGISAVNAALNPAKHNYIFFVATGNGGHKFTENYAQHQKAIMEYKARLKQKANEKK